MLRSRRWTDDDGSASVEFVTAGVLLLVPFVYLVLALGAIQAGALAVEGAARQAARVFVQAQGPAQAQASANRAIEVGLADFGVPAEDAAVTISCSPRPDRCLTRGGLVTVHVAVRVDLPLVPPVLDAQVPLSVPLEASASQQVSRFWGAG